MRKIRALVVAACTALSLAGCGKGIVPVVGSTSQSLAIAGRVHGGQQPITGSTIQLYAVGTTGYGSAPTALGTPSLTDATGSFSLVGHGITCPSPSTRVYLTASGGNPGISGVVNNSAIQLITAIGRCDSITSSSFYFIDEVSTVASVYELAQFMDPATGNIGSYASSQSGLLAAFALRPSLYSLSNGTAMTTTVGGNGIVPQAEINTLANIIASCVNSSGPTSASCTPLFNATTIGASTPANVLTAALSIALHPGNQVSTLMTLSLATAPFQPSLTTTPNDFTLALTYTVNAFYPTGVAVDGGGNIWIADYKNPGGGFQSCLVRLSPLGQAASPFCNGTNGIFSLAIDNTNSVWGASSLNNSITSFDFNGNSVRGPFTVGSSPESVAVDGNNNIWVANTNSNSISVVSNSGSTATYSGGGLAAPDSIAIDPQGNVWAANYNGSSISEFSGGGSPITTTAYSGGGLNQPQSIAFDTSNNVWAGNNSGSVISELNSTGTPVSSSGYSGGAVGNTAAILFDGSGNLWIATLANKLAEIAPNGTPITPSSGYTAPALNTPTGLAIDPSGNIWVTNNPNPLHTPGTQAKIVEFVGAATPVITPISAGLQNGQINQRPGTPIPVSVVSSALPYYTAGTAYFAQLHAQGGNSGTYTWSLASGSLPTGLTLSTSGLISGTSSASGTTFTVQAADSALLSNTGSKSLTLTPTSALPSGTNTSTLNGRYAMQLNGFNGGSAPTGGAVTGYATIGSLSFDGAGSFTGALQYTGYSSLTTLAITISGTYTLGADNRGLMIVTSTSTPGYLPQQLAFSVGNFSSGTPQSIRFAEFDYTGGVATTGMASGFAKLQDNTTFIPATIAQTFVFGLTGETPCNGCGSTSTFGTLSAAGRFVNSSGTSTGEMDAASDSASYPGVTLAGSYTAPDATTGAGTLTLSPTGTLFSSPPTHYAYTVVNAQEILLLSADGHTTSTLLYGDALAQTGTFTNATIAGTYIASELGAANNSGTATNFPSQTVATLVAFTTTAVGTANIFLDQNQGGQIKAEQVAGTNSPYAIDANGRMTVQGGGPGSPIFYLANATGGFGTEQPDIPSNGGGPAGLLTFERQTGSSFTCSTLAGAFFLGNAPPPTVLSATSGVLTAASGTFTVTGDNSDPSGVLTAGGNFTFTCSADTYTSTLGRLTLTQSNGKPSVAYIVSPTKAILIDIKPNKSQPSMIVLQQ